MSRINQYFLRLILVLPYVWFIYPILFLSSVTVHDYSYISLTLRVPNVILLLFCTSR